MPVGFTCDRCGRTWPSHDNRKYDSDGKKLQKTDGICPECEEYVDA